MLARFGTEMRDRPIKSTGREFRNHSGGADVHGAFGMKTSTAAVAVGAYTVGAFVAYRVLKSARDADADSVAHWLASSVKKSSTTTLLSHLREAFGVTSAPTADDAGGVTGRERDMDAAERIVDGEAAVGDDTPAEEAAAAPTNVAATIGGLRIKTTIQSPTPAPLVPEDFLCPVGRHVMHDPVVCGCMPTCGATFERANVSRWIDSSNGGTCPNTGRPLRRTQLFPNRTLKALIEEWTQAHGGVPDDVAPPEDVMNYVDPPVDPEVHRAARRRRYIESDDEDEDEDEESENEFDSESDENELMREQFPIMQAYRSMTEEDVTESRPGVIVNDIRTDLGRRGVDITPTFQSRVDGAGPVDPRLEVFGGEGSITNTSVTDATRGYQGYESRLFPDINEWSIRDRQIYREVMFDLISKRLSHIRTALHEGRIKGGDVVDANERWIWNLGGYFDEDEGPEYSGRAIPWLCLVVKMDLYEDLLDEDRVNAAYILRECVKGRMTVAQRIKSYNDCMVPALRTTFPGALTGDPLGSSTCAINLEVEWYVLKAAEKVLGHLETDQYGVKNAMALILWDLLMEQQPLAVMPTDDYHSETALRELWCGWETPMLNCGIHVELNGVIDEFMKKHDHIADADLTTAATAAENAKCAARMLKELARAIPEDSQVLSRFPEVKTQRERLLELEISSPRARR